MLLGKSKIITNMRKGRIVIHPFVDRQLGTNSYDVRLGPWYYIVRKDAVYSRMEHLNYPRYTDVLGITTHMYDGPFKMNEEGVVIYPGDCILAHTLEFIGGKEGILADMRCRSSIRRMFLDTNASAGLGDVGYIAPWTMELINDNPHPIKLRLGMRIGQMVFFDTGDRSDEHIYQGKYGSGPVSVEELMKNWNPTDMLPKLYRDWDRDEDNGGYTLTEPQLEVLDFYYRQNP